MAQRTSSRAFYNEGIWKQRNARYYGTERTQNAHRHTGSGHLPQPTFQGWTREHWHYAHAYRFGQPHTGRHCTCQNAETALWRRLQAAGFLRPTRGTGEHDKSCTPR